jgi:hypothetical protein
VFVNLRPGAEEDDVPPVSGFSQLFGNRGAIVPLATWTPDELGLQHGTGQRAKPFLADHGVPVPDEWYVVSDHPRRGIVIRPYDASPADGLRWLVRAATVACPVPITRPWRAELQRR